MVLDAGRAGGVVGSGMPDGQCLWWWLGWVGALERGGKEGGLPVVAVGLACCCGCGDGGAGWGLCCDGCGGREEEEGELHGGLGWGR